MPFVKYPRATEPLWHEWDRKAQKCGLRHTVYAVNGDQYTGEWLHNLKHGKGTQVWKRTGAIYSGDWKFGKRDGYGSYSIPDPVTKEYKKVYVGWWKNDKKSGYGVTFYSSGERYEGEWSNGLRSGWGRIYYQNGSIYEGQWLSDQPNGQGMLRLANENRYEGGWKDGKKHGPGKFFYLEKGQLFEGIWSADIPQCGILIDFGRDEAPAPTPYPIPKETGISREQIWLQVTQWAKKGLILNPHGLTDAHVKYKGITFPRNRYYRVQIELADPDGVLTEAQVMSDDSHN